MELIESELNSVKGLIHHLNSTLLPREGSPIAVDATVIDSNGDKVGEVRITATGEYALVTL